MNELHFPLRVLENDDGTVTLLVKHQDVTSWGQHKQTLLAQTDKTRAFCNWIRKQYPHIPTEFRYLAKKQIRDYRSRWCTRYRTVNTDKHFVAYHMAKNELLMIKLAWSFTTQRAEYGGESSQTPGAYLVELDKLEPTPALIERLAKKIKAKPVKL